jgi:hypothetical protein
LDVLDAEGSCIPHTYPTSNSTIEGCTLLDVWRVIWCTGEAHISSEPLD